MKGGFSATLMLLSATPAIAAPGAHADTPPQRCAVRPAHVEGVERIRATYIVACPGTGATKLAVAYDISGSSGGAAPTRISPAAQVRSVGR